MRVVGGGVFGFARGFGGLRKFLKGLVQKKFLVWRSASFECVAIMQYHGE
jgi:hypothetical protein